jgi:hypothetical protein
MRIRIMAIFFAVAGLAVPLLTAAERIDPRSFLLTPLKTDSPPVIDGNLNDIVWAEAPSATDFEIFIPEMGKKQPEKTVVSMAYDSDNLYFAFRCFDDEPDKIKAAVSQRDKITNDDFVCINLDSFNDQQSLYAFYVNPLGIQGDSRFASNNEDFSVDMVWYSAGRIDEKGYTVEMRIPLKSIRYASGDRVLMAVFFERTINRRQEHGSYPPMDPARGHSFLTQMARMEYFGLKRYTLFELLPAFTFGRNSTRSEGVLQRSPDSRELSLTGKYGLTPSLILDGTINPDFSQIEADAGQVDANLRYDLYYPEKRPFFLEGSENFNVGAAASSPLLAVVHTRTIIDPKIGFKLTGKVGPRDTIASIFAVDAASPGAEGGSGAEDATFGIFRYRRTTSQDGYLGLFYTSRIQNGRNNYVAGTDGQIRVSKAGMLSFHAFGSSTRPEEGAARTSGRALSLDYFHDTNTLGLSASLVDISPGFEADTGYLIRTGLTSAVVNITPRIYPKWTWLRRVSPFVELSALKDYDSGLMERDFSLGMTAVLKGSTAVSVTLSDATEIFLGRRFQTDGFKLVGKSQITKWLYFALSFRNGKAIRYSSDSFQGYGTQSSASAVFQPTENLNLSLTWTYADLFRSGTGERVYDYNIYWSRLTYQMNKYLFFRGIVEYNAYRGELLTDFLASFTYIPGTVIHLGYGSLYEKTAWEDGIDRPSDRLAETRRGFFFKASYLWRW